VFTIASRNFDSSVIAVVGPEGGTITRLLPGIVAVFAAPDHLIVTRNDGTIAAVPFDARSRRMTGEPAPLVTGLRTGPTTTVGFAAVAATGRLIYVAAGWGQSQDPADLVWVDRGGATTALDSNWTGAFLGAAISPDGRRVVVGVSGDHGEDLLVRDLSSGSQVRVAMPGSLLRYPVFSADGRRLYFLGLGASHGIHRVDPGGAATPERVVATAFTNLGDLGISPDEDQAYYVRATADGSSRIARSSLSGGEPDVYLTPVGAGVARPQLSPDGRWLAFLWVVSGRPEIHVRSTDTTRTEDWRVSAPVDRRTSIRWSRTGDQLFYVANDAMMTVPVRTNPSFSAGVPRALFRTNGLKPHFDLGPDGRFLMMRWRPHVRPPTVLMMLERWTDLLPR
jgi:dipeptidyl aminopeptidase/acylaminoacyl peptidase